MCYPDDLCAFATSVSSPTGIALNASPCALSCYQRPPVSCDQPAVPHLCGQCGCVRNVALPWSYWNGLPQFSCGSAPLHPQLFSNHETIFLNSPFLHLPWVVVGGVPVRGPSKYFPTRIPEYSLHNRSISPLQTLLQRAPLRRPSGWVAFETHNGRGPNWASFKRLYRKRPGGHLSPSRRSLSPGRSRYSTSVFGSLTHCVRDN